MSRTNTRTYTDYQYRIMVKYHWSSRYTELCRTKDLALARHMVQERIVGKDNRAVWDRYRSYPYEDAEFRVEGRSIERVVTINPWKPAYKIEAEIEVNA